MSHLDVAFWFSWIEIRMAKNRGCSLLTLLFYEPMGLNRQKTNTQPLVSVN